MESYRVSTVDEIIADLGRFTPQQHSLAWSPEPPFVSDGGHDCRIGGSCGLDFNRGTPRARWIQARHRYRRLYPSSAPGLPLRPL